MAVPPNYLLEMENVHVAYPQDRRPEKVVLNNIALRVRPGEFLTMIGPSGCGKSTILRLVLGSQFPSGGSVLFDGRPVCQVDRQRGIVYQAYSLFPNLSVVDNIAAGPILASTSLPQRLLHTRRYRRVRRHARAEARRMLGQIGLTAADFDKYPDELSGGMRQRVAIAQAAIMRPKILLMDEPFGALDHTTREAMQLFALEKWQQYGMTVIFVTHDLEEALFLGTRVIGLSQYWRGGEGDDGCGAMVVVDKEISGAHPKPTAWKYTHQFQTLLQNLRDKVLEPDHRQHLAEFDLTHHDAVRVDDWENGSVKPHGPEAP